VLIKPLPYRGCLVFLISIGCPLALVELVYKGLYFIINFLKATLKASRKASFLIFLVLYYNKLLILLLL
jgi:hypothetical protein